MVEQLADAVLASVSCGSFHTLAVAEGGAVYSFG